MTLVFAQPIAYSRMRKAVIRTVTASAMVPQFTLEVDIPVAPLVRAKDAARAGAAQGDAAERVSISDVIHLAVASTLAEHRGVNASYTEAGCVLHSEVNLAFIVELGDGMVTPTILGADRLTIGQLAAERIRLSAAAQAGSLTPAELMNGTFAVSNLGPLGIHRFAAMVLPPQAAVLAVGAPTAEGVLTLTLSCDHRVLDGAAGARFLRQLAAQLVGEETS